MIKFLSQKLRLNFIMRVSLINIAVTGFLINASYAHGATAVEEKTEPATQGILISGSITDETGSPVPGVNVLEKGTTNGTTSDTDGAYKITVTDANATLVFSFIGYTSQEVAVANQSTIN